MAVDFSRPVAPPAKPGGATRGRPPGATSAKAAEARIQTRTEGVNALGQMACIPVMMLGKEKGIYDAGAISTHWPNVSHEAAKLAETNTNIAKVVDYLCAVGPFAGLLTAVIPLALQVMVNHDVLTPNATLVQMGVVDKRTLGMQMEAQAAQAQADAEMALMEAQAQAAAQSAAARERLAAMVQHADVNAA